MIAKFNLLAFFTFLFFQNNIIAQEKTWLYDHHLDYFPKFKSIKYDTSQLMSFAVYG